MDAELEKTIGRLTVTAAHVETSLLRVLAPISGMDLGSTIAFVGRMHAEPLIDTIERLLEHRHLKDVGVVGTEWRSLKKELRDFLGFRGRVAHTSWVVLAGKDGPRDPPGVLRPWRRELDFDTVSDLSAEMILEWVERGTALLSRLQKFAMQFEEARAVIAAAQPVPQPPANQGG